MVVDTGMRASLVEAGLVDPSSGEFTSAPNFGAPPESESPREPQRETEDTQETQEATTSQEQTTQATQSQGAESTVTTSPGADTSLGSGDPSQLGQAADPIRVEYDRTISEMTQQAQMAYLYGQTLVNEEGQRIYSDEQLTNLIGRELQHASQQAYLAGVMQRMQPVAKRAAAEKIAKDHGVDVDDILNENTPVAMETRAKTIAELKRDGRFQARKSAGTDTAEGSRSFSNAIPEALEKLSPQQKMYVGFARGDH